jgi:hypothetical protein
MAAVEPTRRGDSPLERYVRQLLRDADRMRRTAPPRRPLDKLRPLPPQAAPPDQRPPAG